MAKKRITELATETTLKDGQYVAIDHATDGTKKLNLGAELSDLKEDLSEYESIFTGDVDESVKNWLDEHPEATTTVQDGSITKAKLIKSLSEKISNKINAIEYGFVADGTTDNSAIMTSYLANDANIPIYFPKGEYAFASSIILTDCYINLDNNAKWKYIGESASTVFVHIQPNERVLDRYLCGGIIDANGCSIGIANNNTRFLRIENVSVYNFTNVGISLNYSQGSGNGSGCYLDNVFICGYDDTDTEDVGIDISNCNDSRLNNIVVQDAKIGIYTHGGNNKVHNFHHWVSTLKKYIGSITIKNASVNSGAILFDNLTCDTVQCCIKGFSGSRVIVSGLYFFGNREVISALDSQAHPSCLFDVVDNSIIIVNDGLLDCFDVYGKMCSSASYTWSETGKVDINVAYRSDGNLTNVISKMSPVVKSASASDYFTVKSGWKIRNSELILHDSHLTGNIIVAKTDESAISTGIVYSLLTNNVAFSFGMHVGVILSDQISASSQTTTVTTAFIPNGSSGTTNIYNDNSSAKYVIFTINALLA